jgi:Secretion system C-terminal sorting domain
MKHAYALLSVATILSCADRATAQNLLHTGFDDVPSMVSNGWIETNKSNPAGPDFWQQGALTLGANAYTGDSASYLQNSFACTDPMGAGTISDWFISPAVTMQNGDSVSLWALSFNSASFPDRVECRISPNGGSNVGADENSVGDFSTLIFSINPDLTTTDFPSIQVDAASWTRFAGAVTGLAGATSCRVAIRYFVTDGGGAGANSSTVGVDELDVFRGENTIGLNERSITGLSIAPNPTTDFMTIRTGSVSLYDLNIVSTSGQLMMVERFTGTTTVDLRSLANGVYALQLRELSTGAVARDRIVRQ